MADYYDLVLGLIPLVLVGVTGALLAAGVQLTIAIPLSSVVAVGLIGHAMFVRTPTNVPSGGNEPPRAAD